MAILEIFILSFLIGLSGAVSPGPLLAITVADTYKYGSKTGFLITAGHAFLELIVVLFFLIGMTSVLKNENVFKSIVMTGSVVLFTLGVMMVKNAGKNLSKIEFNSRMKHSFILSLPFKGIVVSLSNPYWFVWWITIGLAYYSVSFRYGIKGVLAFFIGHILADFFWYCFVSWSLWKNKRLFGEKFFRIANVITGFFLMGLALFFTFRFVFQFKG